MSISPRSRRSWPLFLALGLVVALVAAWTGLWFYLSAQAKAEFATWRERERQAGRQQDCTSFSVSGYPLQIEMHCTDASFEVEGSPVLKLTLPSVSAGVQVYDPSLLISDLKSPLNISERSGQNAYVVDWQLGQARVRGLPSQADSGALTFDALSVRDPAAAGGDSVFTARRFELHGQQAPRSTAAHPIVQTTLKLKQAIAQGLHHLATAKPIDADVTSVVSGVSDLSPKPLSVALRDWQARDGAIQITKARLQQDDIIVEGAGNLRLTSRGGLDGNLDVSVVGIQKVLQMFDLDRVMSEGQIGATLNMLDQLIPGLGDIARQTAAPSLAATIGEPSEIDGKPARRLSLRFEDGTVYVGPIPVGEVPPLF